jgi:hypothetical protein
MNYRGAIIEDMARMFELFSSHCPERETFDWLQKAAADKGTWQKAHGVFSHIRNKTVKAERAGREAAATQYLFEEICAKTLYNLSGGPAPFDSDSPFWLLPNAIGLARCLGIPDADVLDCITIQGK